MGGRGSKSGGKGAGRGAGGVPSPLAIVEPEAVQTVIEVMPEFRVKLPKDPRRLNIDVAIAALRERGYTLDFNSGQYDPNQRSVIYSVRIPSGEIQQITDRGIRNILYPKKARS